MLSTECTRFRLERERRSHISIVLLTDLFQSRHNRFREPHDIYTLIRAIRFHFKTYQLIDFSSVSKFVIKGIYDSWNYPILTRKHAKMICIAPIYSITFVRRFKGECFEILFSVLQVIERRSENNSLWYILYVMYVVYTLLGLAMIRLWRAQCLRDVASLVIQRVINFWSA